MSMLSAINAGNTGTNRPHQAENLYPRSVYFRWANHRRLTLSYLCNTERGKASKAQRADSELDRDVNRFAPRERCSRRRILREDLSVRFERLRYLNS